MRIEWLSGQVQELVNVPANQILTIQEPPTLERIAKIQNGQVELKARGWKGFTYAIEASSDLKNWIRIGVAKNLTDTLQAQDAGVANQSRRFYRLASISTDRN